MKPRFPISLSAALILLQSVHAASTIVARYEMGELEVSGGATVNSTAAALLPTVGSTNMPVAAGATPTIGAGGAYAGSNYFMNFDGVTERYEVGPNLLGGITDNWMIEAWVRPQAGGSGLGLIVSHGHGGAGHILNYDATNNLYGWFVGGVGQFNGAVGTATPSGVGTLWDHLALVRTGGIDYLYVNGVLAGQNAAQGTTPYAGGSAIGSQLSGGGNHGFTGDIDDVYFSSVSGTFSPADDLHMIPEPTVALLGSLGVLGLLRRRR